MTFRPGDEEEWVIIGRVVRVEKNLYQKSSAAMI